MLARKNRLHREDDIKRVLRTGRRIRTSTAVFTITKADSKTSDARIAVVVGKRVHALATVRHRVQRILRAITGDVLRKHPTGYDMVVVAQEGAATHKNKADFADVYDAILKSIATIV